MGQNSSREQPLQVDLEQFIVLRDRWDSPNITFLDDMVVLGNQSMTFESYARLMGENNAIARREQYLSNRGILSRFWETYYGFRTPPQVHLVPDYRTISKRRLAHGESIGFSSFIPGDLTEFSQAIARRVRILSQVMENTVLNVSLRYTAPDGRVTFRSIPGAVKMSPQQLLNKLLNMETILQELAGSDLQDQAYHLDTSYFEVARIVPPSGSGLQPGQPILTLGHFVVDATPNQGDDCLFYALGLNTLDIHTIRHNLDIKGPMPATTQVMTYLESIVGQPIDILDSNITTRIIPHDVASHLPIDNFHAEVIEDYTYIYHSPNPSQDRIQLVLSDANGTYHYYRVLRKVDVDYCPITGRYPHPANTAVQIHYLLEQGRLQRTEDVEELLRILREYNNPDKYLPLAYDIETVIGPGGKLIPYSVAYQYEGSPSRYITGPKCLESFVKILQDSSKILLIGFNSMKFDNHLLLEAFLSMDIPCRVSLGGTNILDITWDYGNKCLDLYKFVGMSLRDACREFGISQSKGDLDHDEVQRSYEAQGKVDVTQDMIAYNRLDVECTMELFLALRKVFKDRGMEIEEYCTLGQMAYRHWRAIQGSRKDTLVRVQVPYSLYKHSRASLYGGISAVWDRGVKEGEIAVVDCVSLYPYVMMEYEYPCGEATWVTKEHHEHMGIYRCDILGQNRPIVVPRRSEEKSLDWDFQGPQKDLWLNSVDIASIREEGGTIRVHEGWIWPKKAYLFKNWLQTWKDLKMEQDRLKGSEGYNACLRTMAKNMQNILSGKMAQRAFETESAICTKGGDTIHFVQTHRDTILKKMGDNYLMLEGTKKSWPTAEQEAGVMERPGDMDVNIRCHPAWLASFIYAYSRRHMRRKLLGPYRGYMTETDSYMVPLREYERMKLDPGLIGGDYGQFKLEGVWNGGIFVAKKCYHLGPGDSEDRKARFKGVGVGDRVLLGPHDLEDLNPMARQISLRYLYPRGVEGLPREMYERMVVGDKVWVICRYIKRDVGNLYDVYTIKECIIKED